MSLREWGIYLRPMFAAGTMALLGIAALSGTMMSLPEGPVVRLGVTTQPSAATTHGRMVFVLTSGCEDVQKMRMSLAGALAARQSRVLEDVVWLACGRGVEALANFPARPQEISDLAHQAQAAGVRLVVCDGGLQSLGLTASRLDPAPDVTASQGVVALSQLVAQGYQVVQP